jgi:HEPN domain-containing protein
MNVPESKRWLAYARSDLDAAHALLRDTDHYPRQVCFLAQQAAEKALKAVLVLLEIEFPFKHDLDRLRDLLPEGWRVKSEYPDLADEGSVDNKVKPVNEEAAEIQYKGTR